jgi:conjugative relaxase-like TrwC/TraI family protein
MLTIRAMSDGKGYSCRHLEHSDYYAEGERVRGFWHGRGAKLLGLDGETRSDDFESLRQGLEPGTGEFLRQRKSADRIASDGTTLSKGRNLYDFTISAPKSVSVMAILGGDARLLEAHERAVHAALEELESHAAARVRRSGANTNRTTGNLVLAVYHHDTSRELDPQLHTHAVAANLTYDGTEGRWKALQASEIYERRSYLTEVYRNALARQVRSLGYDIENRLDRRGRDCGFEICGIPEDVLTKFSRRSRQRDEAIRGFTARNGRPPTDNEVAVLVRESRADKLIEISTADLRVRQRERLDPNEARLLADLKPETPCNTINRAPAEVSLEYAKDHVFERVSVARDHEILAEALRHGRGQISHEELTGALSLQKLSGKILHHGEDLATIESLAREREMIRAINRGIGGCEPLGKSARFVPSDRLNPEQKQTVDFVLSSRDRAVNISGAAGTGKTATLQGLRQGLISAGRGIVAVAPTMSAVEELQRVGMKDSMTIERLLQDPQSQADLAGKVLIVDEAGMVSGRQMSQLLQLAARDSIRLIFSGDTKQIQSVESCDALRILEKESRLKTVSLTHVQRQTAPDYREAIQELRRDPAAGIEKLDAMGAVREVSWLDRPQAVARAFAEFQSRGRKPLVVCATHEEIDRVTEAIRLERKTAGGLRKGRELLRDVSLNWTAAQKSDIRNLRPGQFLGFHRAVKGIAKYETLEVLRVEGTNVIVRNDHGAQRQVTGKQCKSFDVFERRSIEVAPGDRLQITANRRRPGFRVTNGEIVTVKRVDRNGRIHFQDGRSTPGNFRQFSYGYAVTAHRSQGKSVDSVIISADGMKRELFYVAASRGKKSAVIITSDKQLLRDAVGRSTARQSATELARKLRPGLHQEILRGMDAARRLATWAARHLSPVFRISKPAPHLDLGQKPHAAPSHETKRQIIREQSHDHDLSL